MWFAGDGHVAALQFVDDIVNTIDAETRVVPARHVVAVVQILIGLTLIVPNHRDFVFSQERAAWITSVLRSRGNQWPEGRFVTVRSWHALRMGSPKRVWVISAEPIEVTVNKQHGLAQLPAIGCLMSVGDVGAIVQIPGTAGPKSVDCGTLRQGRQSQRDA